MPFEIVRNNIVNMQVDAIVNTANPKPKVGSGLDRLIHQKAGDELLKAREQIGEIYFGDAAITSAFNLDARYVIHTVGPIWVDGNHHEEQILGLCYRHSLELAKAYHCESVAFPLIATGNYGFPKPLALQVALKEISAFLLNHDMLVYLVIFDRESFVLSEKLFKSVSSYIDDYYMTEVINQEYDFILPSGDMDKNARISDWLKLKQGSQSTVLYRRTVQQQSDLSQWLKDVELGFSETLLQLIDKSGKKDSEVYKKANVDRKLFSKIRNNVDYKPSKSTALAFAFALELSLDETKDFIARAGYALSHSSKFDLIVEFFLVNHNYDVFNLNEVLFAFDQPLIGA